MGEVGERIHVLTFPELQAKRRQKSILIFFILSAYYIASFLFLTWVVKLILFRMMFNLTWIPLWFTPKQALVISLSALGFAGLHWAFSIPSALQKIENALRAQPPDPRDRYHRVFQNTVEEMMISSGMKNVRPVILPSLSVNAFAAGDMRGKAMIGVTEGLLARLDRSQLQGVVAHEMAHIAEGDHIINTIVCSLFAVFAQLIEMTPSMMGGGAGIPVRVRSLRGRVTVYPFAVIIWTGALWVVKMGGLLLKMALSREREYLADATAVQLTRNPLGLAEALYKISRSWRGKGFVSDELAPLFLVNPEEKWLDEKEGKVADLFSTHPPIRKRIFALLNQARTPLSALRKRIEETKERREAAKEIEKIPRWMVYREGKWEGPFGIGELTGFNWFSPASWVSQEGNEEFHKASEESLLTNLFQSRLPSAPPLSKFSPEGQSLCCPRCKQELRVSDYEGVYVLRCIFCRGTLVRNERLPRILAREEKGFTPEQRKWAGQWESREHRRLKRPTLPGQDEDSHLLCPKCQQKMIRNFYSYQYFILVDRCRRCNWIWFDSEELSLLQMLVEKSRSHESITNP